MCPDHNRRCPCANWDYERFDKKGPYSRVRASCKHLHVELKTGNIDVRATTQDTRQLHQSMFSGLTARNCEYFAGNFRGSIKCLIDYDLASPSDTTPARDVAAAMGSLTAAVRADWEAFDSVGADAIVDDQDRFLKWLDVALERMVTFLSVHPYANGNGHVSRFFILCYLAAAGIFPESWPIDKRPPSPYIDAIVMFRNGYADELRELVLKYISGEI